MYRSPIIEPGAANILECVGENVLFSKHIQPVINFASRFIPYSGNILELHNDRGPDWFDFSLRINSEYDKNILTEKISLKHVPLLIYNGYRQILNESLNGFLHGIKNIWFEFDCPFQREPSLFFDVQRSCILGSEKQFGSLRALTSLFNYSCYPQLEHFITRLAQLDLNVVYFGLMLPRKSGAIRLTINGINSGNLIQILLNLGWQGNFELLKYLGEAYFNSGQKMMLDVDFDYQLGGRIGIEVFDSDEFSLVPKLYQNKIYNSEQYGFIKSWPGTTTFSSQLADALSDVHQRRVEMLHRRINHFKFSIEGDKVKTKAYLYYCF